MKIFDKLQNISKALLLPVSALPAAAIFFRFGAKDLLNIEILEKAGSSCGFYFFFSFYRVDEKYQRRN